MRGRLAGGLAKRDSYIYKKLSEAAYVQYFSSTVRKPSPLGIVAALCKSARHFLGLDLLQE